MRLYKGIPVSQGIAVGEVYRYLPYVPEVNNAFISPKMVSLELMKLEKAKREACEELEALLGTDGGDREKTAIVTAHIEILKDPALEEMVRKAITDSLYNVKWALDQCFQEFIKMLSCVKDDLIRERIIDMQDVKNRLLRNCDGLPEQNLLQLSKPVIVLAAELLPSNAASMKRQMVKAIVTETGNAASHTAIIARSFGIPALSDVASAMALLKDGEIIGVDAIEGVVVAELDQMTLDMYKKKEEEINGGKGEYSNYE